MSDFDVGSTVTVIVSVPDRTVGGLTAGDAVLIYLEGEVLEESAAHVACSVHGLPPADIDNRRGLWFPKERFINTDMHRPEVFLFDWIGVWKEGDDAPL